VAPLQIVTKQQSVHGGGVSPDRFANAIPLRSGAADSGCILILPPADSYKLSLKVRPATGKFTGSFVHPLTSKPVPFTGLFLQATENEAGGFFLGPNTSGAVMLEP